MELTFLGTGAGNFQGSRRQPCAALLDGLLLDCGAGATGRLEDAGRLGHVDGVLLSHLHTDHIAGLFDLLLHSVISERRRPMTIVSPPGLRPILDAFVRAQSMVFDPATRFDLRVVESLQPEVTIGRWNVRGVPLEHTVPDLGYLMVSDQGSAFYTGDTREPSAALGLRTEVLIHEATYPDQYAERATAFGHSTASQAARAAREMTAQRLFLTHLGSLPETDAEVLREARAGFPDAEVPDDRRHYTI